MVEELVLEAVDQVRHGLALGVGQVGAGGVEPLQLAEPDGVGVVAELAEQRAGVALVLEVGRRTRPSRAR